jgi:hypothetical protein
MTAQPQHVGTLGDTIASGFNMSIYCEAMDCHHGARVDLGALRDGLGADYRVADFVDRSVCGRCGARWPQISIRVSPIQTGPAASR